MAGSNLPKVAIGHESVEQRYSRRRPESWQFGTLEHCADNCCGWYSSIVAGMCCKLSKGIALIPCSQPWDYPLNAEQVSHLHVSVDLLLPAR
jgi:hypothetical protein